MLFRSGVNLLGAYNTLTPFQGAGAVAQGMTAQHGNEIDEFTTEALRNNLVGLPLDLPSLNITRARRSGAVAAQAGKAACAAATA